MSTTTESIQEELPPYLAAAYREAAERALKLSHEPYEAYPHGRVAPHSPHTRQALRLSQQTGSYAPYLQGAHHHIQQGSRHFPNHYQEYMQPYQQEVVNPLEMLGQRNFREGFMPELEKRFVHNGPGIARHPNFGREAGEDAQAEIKSQQEDAMSRGYQHAASAFDLERARSLEGAGLMTRLGVSDQAGHLADIQALREAGLISQDQEQAMLNQAYEEWKEEKRHPYEKLQEYFGILQGTPAIPSTYTKREVIPPSDTYHHGDWGHVAENIGLDALGGMLRGHEPSPAIIAAFRNVLPGSSERSRSSRVPAREGPSPKEREEERRRLREADEQRIYQETIGPQLNLMSQMEAQGQYPTQYAYDLAAQQARQAAVTQAAQLEAQRQAAAQLEAKRQQESDRQSREAKRRSERSSARGIGETGSRVSRGTGEDKPRRESSNTLSPAEQARREAAKTYRRLKAKQDRGVSLTLAEKERLIDSYKLSGLKGGPY